MPFFLLPLLTWAALLLRYPKRTLAVAVPLFSLIIMLALWLQWQESSTEQRLAGLELQLVYAPEQCPAEQPLQVSLHNTSDLALHSLSWRIAAYRPGERTNLVEDRYNNPVFDSRQPLQPDARWQSCLPLPALRSGYRASTLEFRAEQRRGHFASPRP